MGEPRIDYLGSVIGGESLLMGCGGSGGVDAYAEFRVILILALSSKNNKNLLQICILIAYVWYRTW